LLNLKNWSGDKKMSEIKMAPDLCAYPDEEHNALTIEIELPGVPKENITFKLHKDSFYKIR